MKKRIILILIIILFATGCTCEYNLQIENNTYKESVTLKSNDTDELSNFSKDWKISINKNENNIGLDEASDLGAGEEVYKYNLTGNNLTFSYDFLENEYQYSSAVSKCYKNLSVSNYNGSIIISTSPQATCFDAYPTLEEVTINITIDKNVTSNNADSVSGNTYTWKLNKQNAGNKAINLVLKDTDDVTKPSSSSSSNIQEIKKKDYTLYIFLGILLIITLLGYFIFNIIKNKQNDMDV